MAYDKLLLSRPASEPSPVFGAWTDQPFLDLMTQKAIDVLGGADGSQPFILMVEGASVDKQSHPNHAAGVIWDVIELDKSVGVEQFEIVDLLADADVLDRQVHHLADRQDDPSLGRAVELGEDQSRTGHGL